MCAEGCSTCFMTPNCQEVNKVAASKSWKNDSRIQQSRHLKDWSIYLRQLGATNATDLKSLGLPLGATWAEPTAQKRANHVTWPALRYEDATMHDNAHSAVEPYPAPFPCLTKSCDSWLLPAPFTSGKSARISAPCALSGAFSKTSEAITRPVQRRHGKSHMNSEKWSMAHWQTMTHYKSLHPVTRRISCIWAISSPLWGHHNWGSRPGAMELRGWK